MKRLSIFITAFLVFTQVSNGTCSPSKNILPVMQVTKVYESDVIFSRSKMQSIVLVDLKIDRKPNTIQKLLPLYSINGTLRQSVLFVNIVSKSGKISSASWNTTTSEKNCLKCTRWLTLDTINVSVGDIIKIGMMVETNQTDGYYVSSKVGVIPYRDKYSNMSGCMKIANHIKYAKYHNDGVTVKVMQSPGKGFKGWCYKYRKAIGHSKYYLHFFSISTAQSWADVRRWCKDAFIHVSSKNSITLGNISNELNLTNPDINDLDKINKIQKWMNNNLNYSGEDTYTHIPQSFDTTIKNGYGDCKGLSLVLLELLHAANIPAHIVLTSLSDSYAFTQNSSNLGALDHVAVYVPSVKHFYDPTSHHLGPARAIVGHQTMDLTDGTIRTVQ